jgi:UDP-N-acetylglucosamine 2-epimerase (non-hydrolysing)
VLAGILDQLASLPVPVLLPLHPRTRAGAAAFGLTAALRRLRVCDPLPGPAFLGLAAEAALLVPDSGGLQEECSVLKRPMLVVRRFTERPEVLGTFAELVPPAGLAAAAGRWLADPDAVHARLRQLPCPYGDELAAERVVTELLDRFGAGPHGP